MITNFLEEEGITSTKYNLKDHVVALNSNIVCWTGIGNYSDEDFNKYFQFIYGSNFLIYSLYRRNIAFSTNKEKIIDFQAGDMPMYTLEFVINFLVSASKFLNSNKAGVLVVHDNFNNVFS